MMQMLRHGMSQSPTGRQLALDGSLVLSFLNFDPSDPSANTTQIYPNGGAGLYIRAGVTELWTFTREDGWQLT